MFNLELTVTFDNKEPQIIKVKNFVDSLKRIEKDEEFYANKIAEELKKEDISTYVITFCDPFENEQVFGVGKTEQFGESDIEFFISKAV